MLSTSHTVHAGDHQPRPRQMAEGRGLSGAFEMLAAPMNFDRNEEIYGEGEAAEYLYQVVRGAVRTTKMLEDGRRQIGAFYGPGDFFGLEAGEEHSFSAEAIGASVVRLAKRSAIVAMTERDTSLAAELWAATARSLRIAQDHMLLLGRKTAEERLASFLLSRAVTPPGGQIVVELPMSRQDIADYLGLTIETVSRTFTRLEETSTIELPSSRRIVVRSPSGLQRLNG
jgi:CRP-like cAMP-binding protein